MSPAGDGRPLLGEGRARVRFERLQADSKPKGLWQGRCQQQFLMMAAALLPAWPGKSHSLKCSPGRREGVQLKHSVPSLAIASWEH